MRYLLIRHFFFSHPVSENISRSFVFTIEQLSSAARESHSRVSQVGGRAHLGGCLAHHAYACEAGECVASCAACCADTGVQSAVQLFVRGETRDFPRRGSRCGDFAVPTERPRSFGFSGFRAGRFAFSLRSWPWAGCAARCKAPLAEPVWSAASGCLHRFRVDLSSYECNAVSFCFQFPSALRLLRISARVVPARNERLVFELCG